MGSAISNSANGAGTVIGDVLAAPFKAIFGGSCQGVCSGTWDISCFIEHFCITNLFKFVMVLGLCLIILMFLGLTFKLGICQCISRSLCKMSCALCKTYWYAFEDMTCFLWFKLKNVKRVNRRRNRRYRDLEFGYSSNEEDKFRIRSKRKLFGEEVIRSSYPSGRRTFRVRRVNSSKYRKHHRRLNSNQMARHTNKTHVSSSKRRRLS